jgi:branched-chain amino acid transport system substrate-binding protein
VTKRRLSLLGIFVALSLTAAACGDDSETADETGDEATEATDDASSSASATDETAESDGDAEGDDVAEPSGEPVQIGVLTSLTGNFTPWGIQTRDGMQMAVDELNEAGGIDGRPVELNVIDDESNAEAATAGFERLVDDGAVAIAGTISSDVGLATSLLAEELETPLFLIKAGSEAILTTDSRYTFRTCLPAAPMIAGPIAQYVESEGITKVGAIIADYAWGQSVRAALEDQIGALDGVELQVEVAPVPETEFTTYLRNLEGFGPELIVATGHPPGSGTITVQSADLGLDVPVTGAYSPQAGVVGNAPDAAIGRYADFSCADYESPEYQELAARFIEGSDNTFMEDDAIAGYGLVMALAQTITEVGDDRVAIAEHLHANSFAVPGMPNDLSWTEWGELAAVQPVFTIIGEGPAPEGVNAAGDWYPETLILSDPLTPYEPS